MEVEISPCPSGCTHARSHRRFTLDVDHNYSTKLSRRGFIRGGAAALITLGGLGQGMGSAIAQRRETPLLDTRGASGPTFVQRRPNSFILGTNYVGAADRCWQMWNDDRYDSTIIDTDFARAAEAGVNTMRIFVQRPLAVRLLSDDWSRLDATLRTAERRGVGVVLTLCDYLEQDLTNRATLNGLIASRYRGHSAIVAYDLTNEPQWWSIITAAYPVPPSMQPAPTPTPTLRPGATPSSVVRTPPAPSPLLYADAPIIRDGVMEQFYGMLSDPEEEMRWRAKQPFGIPERFGVNERIRIHNAMVLLDEMLVDMRDWINANPGSSPITYLNQRVGSTRWAPLVTMLDDTLWEWLRAQIGPIRVADPNVPIICGYNQLLTAGLRSNQELDMVSFHHYLSPSDDAPQYMANIQGDLVQRVGRPTLWGEFGWSTYDGDPDYLADLEIQALLLSPTKGMVGGMKWMLYDALNQVDPKEAFFGLYDSNGQPKASARRFRQFRYG